MGDVPKRRSLPKLLHEIGMQKALFLYNAITSRDSNEIERFKRDVHYVTFTGELETVEQAKYRRIFFWRHNGFDLSDDTRVSAVDNVRQFVRAVAGC